jgi:16S rRNA (cytosine967-C5)-methyltransferase
VSPPRAPRAAPPRSARAARSAQAPPPAPPSPPAPPGAATRALAARCVHAVLVEGQSLKAALERALPTLTDPRDRALLEAICFAALRHRGRYEAALDAWLQRGLRGRDAVVHALLLCGLAQLDALRLSPHAAVAATTEAARVLERPALVGLVNALLRRAARESPWPEGDDAAAKLSHPAWLLSRLEADWPGDWPAIVAANNAEAPLWLAVNPRIGSRDAYLGRLRAEGLDALAPDAPPLALRLDAPAAPSALPGWAEGAAWVQDGAAQLAVEALDPAPGMRVLDACAAPGGKAAQLASRLDATGALVAVDLDARRLRRVGDNLRRLGLASPQVLLAAADATQPGDWDGDAPFDAILLDAPCSATGIIRRQPDIKWHRQPADVEAAAALQTRLLAALWPRLRPGGRLLYATCSVLREENVDVVDAFLATHADARAVPLDARFGRAAGPGRQRLPGEDGMDGFFYALLEKHAG